MMTQEFREMLDRAVTHRLPSTLELYRHFHANPELSCQEAKTADRVAVELKRLGLAVHSGIGGHGVVAILENGPGPSLLIRADMDALPIREQTDLPYASHVTGIDPNGNEVPVMHACGHDLHTANLIGTAAVLADLKNHWSGTVLFVAQPAEETIGGAALMMGDNIYARFGRPDHALALHVDPFVAAGAVTLSAGVQSSCNHAVDMKIRGIGGHAASPHRTKDPILLAAQIIMALQTLVSRETDPLDMAVITVGSIHGGTKRNIIPEEVILNLTIRAYDRSLADTLLASVYRTATGLARAYGLPEALWPEIVQPEKSFLPVINDPHLTALITDVFRDLLGNTQVSDARPSTGSEDFSFFGECDPPVPLLMYHLGVTDPGRLEMAKHNDREEKICPVHDPGFFPEPERSLPTAMATMSAAAIRLLESGRN